MMLPEEPREMADSRLGVAERETGQGNAMV